MTQHIPNPAVPLSDDGLDFKGAFDNAAVGFIRGDADGHILNVNQTFCHMIGYTAEELVGSNHALFVHPDFKAAPPDFARLMRGEIDFYHREKQYIRKDGTPVWTIVSVSRQADSPDGRPCIINFIRDISEQKRAEQALRESEQRYRLLTEAAPHMTWTKNTDMQIEFVSQSWTAFTGLTADEAREHGWLQLVHPDDRERLPGIVSGPLDRGEEHEVELRMRRHDGQYRWVAAKAVPLKDETGAVVKWIGTTTDVHDRKRTEMRLAAQHAISSALATAESLDQAYAGVLDALCQHLNIDLSELWLPEDDGKSLSCAVIRAQASFAGTDAWTELTRKVRMKPGQLLPGTAWTGKTTVSYLDATTAPPGPRKALAMELGIRCGMAFPLMLGEQSIGAICLHTREQLTEDPQIEGVLLSMGQVIAQFMVREKTERALAESERRFRLTADAGGIGIWDYDIRTGQARWSERQEQIFGVPPGGFEGTQEAFLGRVHPDDREMMERVLASMSSGGASHTFEYRIVRPDGEVRWVYCNGTVMFNAAHEPIRLFGIVSDITERKRLEQAQQFLAEASNVLSSSLDYNETLNRIAELAVPSFADWCVVNVLEPDGSLPLAAVVHQDVRRVKVVQKTTHADSPDPSGTLQKVISTRKPMLIPHLTREMLSEVARDEKDLKMLEAFNPRSVIIVPLTGGDGVHGTLTLINAESGRVYDAADLATAQDLGHRCALAISNARLYSVLLDSEKRFRETFEHAAAGVAHVSLEGEFLRVNRQLCEMLGYDRDELLNLTVNDIVYPEDLVGDLAQTRRLLDGEITSFTIEKRCLRSDGSTVWVSKEGSLVRHPDGAPDYLLAVIVDISRMKDLEASLKQANSTLEARVQERTAELEAHTASLRLLAARLTQAEQSERKRLAEMIHDDLQQLLVAARMQVASLEVERDAPALAPTRQLAVTLLDQAIEEARSLTVQLRPPALYESGLVATMGWLAGWMEQAHAFHVKLDVDESVEPLAEADAALLFDTLRELLLNAVKYSGTNHASVKLSRPDNAWILLSVSDNGAGFDISTLSSPRSGNGGLGLFSIRERVLSVGGQFEVRSAPGGGTTVELLWPRTELASGQRDETAPPKVSSKGGSARSARSIGRVPGTETIKLLLVDDHALVRQTLAEVLDRQPDVTVVGQSPDGQHAIDAVETHHPHVVVMDVNLPKLNGVQATSVIKQRFPDVRIIGLSIHDDRATRQAMLDAGASAYLSKNGPIETLLETIRRQAALAHISI